ncbi:MAG: TetR/AcrR family transcriptional regulator [Desulfovibrionaceae bacterium]
MAERTRKRKQPQAVRARLLKAAGDVVAERGLAGMTLDGVARRAGVSKGGLTHHFPNRRALVEAMVDDLLTGFEHAMASHLAVDPDPRGRFTRAYILTMAAPALLPRDNRIRGAFALAMSQDETLARRWRDWLHARIANYGEDAASAQGRVIRYAVDGLWLEACSGTCLNAPEERETVVAHLVALTYRL